MTQALIPDRKDIPAEHLWDLSPLKYWNFRKQVLELKHPRFYDTDVPVIDDVDFQMSYEIAVDIRAAAIEPPGQGYSNTLRSGLMGGSL
jgi:oligoendopeptidase F